MVNLDVSVIGGGAAGEDAVKTAERNIDAVGMIKKGVVGAKGLDFLLNILYN